MLQLIKKIKSYIFRRPYFRGCDIKIGTNVSFGKNVVFNCKRVRIGDGVIFQDNITINCDVFEIGDYGTIYMNCFFPGPGVLKIGHNFWLGAGSIVDSQGGTIIGNNVGIGAGSQLWSHMAFGDVMYGARFHGAKPLTIGDDSWLVGHCLVSPVNIKAKSMAMLGSVITKDMEENHCYAGVPAESLTSKIGGQFSVTSLEERRMYMEKRLKEFSLKFDIQNMDRYTRIVDGTEKNHISEGERVIVFNIRDRTYTKSGSLIESKLIRFLLPDAKFTPDMDFSKYLP